MAVASKLVPFLLSLRRFLVRALRAGVLRQALKWLLRRLAFYWTAFRLKWSSSSKNTKAIDSLPPPKSSGLQSGEAIGESDNQQPQKEALDIEIEYTPIIDGETISLHDIMPSLFPLSGDGIHNASQSSRNLQASRSAHSSAISLRSRSQLSINNRGSQYADSKYSNSNYSVNIVEPLDPAPSSPDTALPTTNAPDDMNTPGSPYLQPIDNSSQSRRSPRLVHGDAMSGKTSPTLDNRGSHPSFHLSGPSTTDDRHSMKSCKSQGGYELDELTHTLPQAKGTSIYENRSQIGSSMGLGHTRITPVMPEAILRYSDRPTILKGGAERPMVIQPLTKKFQKPEPPTGWIKHTHPEGACYFFNPTKRIYAEADLHNDSIYVQAMEDIATLEDFITDNKIDEIDDDTDLVICLSVEPDSNILTSYYYVHHQTRSIFFLDTYEANTLGAWNQIFSGATSESHLRHEIETQYWFHCQFYPHSSMLTKTKVQELRDVVMHYIGDTMTSPKCSTAPYPLEELRNILTLTSDMDKNVDGVSVGTHSCFARLMFIFTRARFLHFHGESHARIDRTTSVYGDDIYRRTWLVKTLSLVLFCAPDFHLRNLQSMWVDDTMHKSILKESMKRMNEEWDTFVLFATVMLNANVAFLAIQSVDNSSSSHRSATQIASYVSMIASIGSIVLGLLLSRQNRTKLRETVDEFEQYMTDRRHPILGLETLAILYSLPYALLMWGMVSFLLAVSFLCFMHSDTPTRSIVGASSSFCVMLILWCVRTNWEKEERNEEQTTNGGRLHRTISTFLTSLDIGRRLPDSQQQLPA